MPEHISKMFEYECLNRNPEQGYTSNDLPLGHKDTKYTFSEIMSLKFFLKQFFEI